MFNKLLLTLGAFFSVAFAEPEMEEGVLVLTDDNFADTLAKHQFLLVEFYAPWCGHCKQLAPEYAEAAGILAKKDPPMYLAKVDTTVHEKLGKQYEIEGFPTLKWFVNGKDTEYTGGRTADTIVSWISKKTGPAFDDIECSEVGVQTADHKLSFVFFGAKEGALFDAFHASAMGLENYSFFATGSECAKDHGVAEAPGAAVFRTFDESPLSYTGAASDEDLQSFLKASSVATLFEFDEESVEPIFHEQKAVIILFLEGEQSYKAQFAEASKQLKGEILFSYSGVTDGIQEQLAEFVGVTAEDLPTMRIMEPSEENVRKFKFDGDIEKMTVDDISKFVNDFNAGKLTPFLKSEAIPEDNSGPVKVVVAHQFEDIVLDSTKDVLVKYYAPWCGHCQKLAPHWEELGEHVKDVSDIVIAKYDATLNENEQVSVEGFPTLIFYPKGNKEGVPADGRSFNGLRIWLKEHSEVYKTAFPDEEVEADAEEDQDEDMEGDGEEGEEGEGEFDDEEEDFEEDGDDMANLEDFDEMEDDHVQTEL